MEEDQPGTDTEDLDQQQEHDVHDRAASVLSSIDDIPELEEAPEQEPQSRPTMESEYLGIPIDHRLKVILAVMQAVLSCIHHHI